MPKQKAVFGGVLITVSLIGFLCAVVALSRIVHEGSRRIAIPASVGLLITGGMIWLAVYSATLVKTLIEVSH